MAEFQEVCWPDDDIYIDEECEFKKALGEGGVPTKISYLSLMRPSVIGSIISTGKFGAQGGDIEARTLTVGGTIVIKNSEVLFSEPESSTYTYASVDSVLAACPTPSAPATSD